jgi:hypothetical protein
MQPGAHSFSRFNTFSNICQIFQDNNSSLLLSAIPGRKISYR